MQMYERYGGMWQGSPLTTEEKKYDETCRKIDCIEEVIRGKSMALFTADEFLWFSWFVNKNFFFPKQDRLDEHLKQLTELLDTLSSRDVKP